MKTKTKFASSRARAALLPTSNLFTNSRISWRILLRKKICLSILTSHSTRTTRTKIRLKLFLRRQLKLDPIWRWFAEKSLPKLDSKFCPDWSKTLLRMKVDLWLRRFATQEAFRRSTFLTFFLWSNDVSNNVKTMPTTGDASKRISSFYIGVSRLSIFPTRITFRNGSATKIWFGNCSGFAAKRNAVSSWVKKNVLKSTKSWLNMRVQDSWLGKYFFIF